MLVPSALNTLQAAEMRMAVTTSFHNSGLSDILLPEIKRELDIDVHLIVVGTGQALKLGRSGDVDAILVHSKAAEESFIKDGFAKHRREIMFNDFVVIGPQSDPAQIKQTSTISQAFSRLAAKNSIFVSRGDDSGTHKKELSLWKLASVDITGHSGKWYREVGAGMGATLNTTSGMNAYTLSDRASWLKFKNKGDLTLLYAGDPTLFNQYSYLPISKDRHPHINARTASQLENWLASDAAQSLIGSYELEGEKLFTPNAK